MKVSPLAPVNSKSIAENGSEPTQQLLVQKSVRRIRWVGSVE